MKHEIEKNSLLLHSGDLKWDQLFKQFQYPQTELDSEYFGTRIFCNGAAKGAFLNKMLSLPITVMWNYSALRKRSLYFEGDTPVMRRKLR